MSETITPLRICRVCGLEALTEEDLALFAKNKTSAHGRQNICKKCLSEEAKQRKAVDPGADPEGSARCRVCGRLLTVPESVDRGIGPVCWSAMKHNHTLEDYHETLKEAEI